MSPIIFLQLPRTGGGALRCFLNFLLLWFIGQRHTVGATAAPGAALAAVSRLQSRGHYLVTQEDELRGWAERRYISFKSTTSLSSYSSTGFVTFAFVLRMRDDGDVQHHQETEQWLHCL